MGFTAEAVARGCVSWLSLEAECVKWCRSRSSLEAIEGSSTWFSGMDEEEEDDFWALLMVRIGTDLVCSIAGVTCTGSGSGSSVCSMPATREYV